MLCRCEPVKTSVAIHVKQRTSMEFGRLQAFTRKVQPLPVRQGQLEFTQAPMWGNPCQLPHSLREQDSGARMHKNNALSNWLLSQGRFLENLR